MSEKYLNKNKQNIVNLKRLKTKFQVPVSFLSQDKNKYKENNLFKFDKTISFAIKFHVAGNILTEQRL